MVRKSLAMLGCLLVSGCVSNTVATTNAQIAPANGGAAAAAPAPVAPSGSAMAAAKAVVVNKTTTGGATLLLGNLQSLANDCTPLGDIETKVVKSPEHGTLQIEKGMGFSAFSPGEPAYACNTRRTPGVVMSYRAVSGFTGKDVATIQVFFPDGKAPIVMFQIDVN